MVDSEHEGCIACLGSWGESLGTVPAAPAIHNSVAIGTSLVIGWRWTGSLLDLGNSRVIGWWWTDSLLDLGNHGQARSRVIFF